MGFHSIEEYEQILAETPPAARYLPLHWGMAREAQDWREIRYMMRGAMFAVGKDHPDAEVYCLLGDVANQFENDLIAHRMEVVHLNLVHSRPEAA